MNELTALLVRHCRDNLTTTLIPRLTLSRSDMVTELTSAFYHPLLCIIAEGRKRVFLGNEVLYYNPETYLVASTDLPVSGQVIEAPFFALSVVLDPAIMAEILFICPRIRMPTLRQWRWRSPSSEKMDCLILFCGCFGFWMNPRTFLLSRR